MNNTPPHFNPRGSSIQINFLHNGKRHRKQFPTREDAERYHAMILAMPPDPREPNDELDGPRSGSGPTLAWLLRYVSGKHWQRMPSGPASIVNATQCVNLIGHGRRVSSIDEAAINSVVSHLWRSGLQGTTINRKLTCLGTMFRIAWERGWIKRVPDVGLVRLEWIQPLPYLREDTERRFMEWADGMGLVNLRDLVALLIDTGISPAEAFALRAAEVGECIRFEPKGETPERVITLSGRVRELVERRRSSAAPSGTLFGAYGREDADRDWSLARSALGLPAGPGFGLKCLHDTFCMRTTYRVPGLQGAFAITRATGRRGPEVMNYDRLREQEADGRPYPPAVGRLRTPLGCPPSETIPAHSEDHPADSPGTAPQDDAEELRIVAEAWPWLPGGMRAGIVVMVRAIINGG